MTYLDDLQMVKIGLTEITKQANALAIGLQNAAPAQSVPTSSVQYLFETTKLLEEDIKRIDQLIQEVAT
jgi:hypothetical protein